MKYLSFLLILSALSIISCEQDDCCVQEIDFRECRLRSATGKYVGDSDYQETYAFHYTSEGLLESVDISTPVGEQVREITYSDDKVSLIKMVTEYGEEQQVYQYSENRVTVKMYTISNEDTLLSNEYSYFMPKVTDDGIYFSEGESSEAFEVKNGNIVKSGSYTIQDGEKIPEFYEEYSYDSEPNIFKDQPHMYTLFTSGFIMQRSSSENNLVKAKYIGGGWTRDYVFHFDESGVPGKMVDLNTGHTIILEYECP